MAKYIVTIITSNNDIYKSIPIELNNVQKENVEKLFQQDDAKLILLTAEHTKVVFSPYILKRSVKLIEQVK